MTGVTRPRNSVPRARLIIGEAVIFVAALTVLYLAFRGSPVHPPTGAAAAAAGPSSPSAAGGQESGQGTSVQPSATVRPSVPTAPSAPSASGSGASQAAGPLAAAQAYLAGRGGNTEVAVYDLSTGRQWTLGPQTPQAEEGVARLEILQAVLHQQKVRRTVLSLTQQELAPPMIEQNDSAAAAALWGDAGGARGMRAFDHAAGLWHTSPSAGSSWGLTTSTAGDQITLLRQLARPGGVLDSNSRKYALSLLDDVLPAQRWGVAGGVPAGVRVALANGQRSTGKSGWQVNSVGWVSGGGRDYLMAVLSSGNPSARYGTATLNHLGALVWSALARS